MSDLDPAGRKLRTVEISRYAGEQVRTLYADPAALRADWADPARRAGVLAELDQRGVGLVPLAAEAGVPDADPFDLLCHLAYARPLVTRAERAARLRTTRPDFFARYGPAARLVLDALLDRYAAHGVGGFDVPAVFQVAPLAAFGTLTDIAGRFPRGAADLTDAVDCLQEYLYAE